MPRFTIAPPLLLLLGVSSCTGPRTEEAPAPEAPSAPAADWEESWGAEPAHNSEVPAWTQPASVTWLPRSQAAGTRPGLAPQREVSPRVRLARTRVPFFQVEDEESLRAITRRLQDSTGIPIVVHPSAEDAAFDEGVVFKFDFENPILARDLLNLIVDMAGENVVWTVKHGAVLVTTLEKVENLYVLAMHDIRTLTTPRTNFIGPRIDRIRLLDDLEDEDGGGPFGGIGESVTQYSGDDIMALVQESVAIGTWENEGVSIDVHEGLLIVKHSQVVQRQVRFFLAALGA